MQRFITYSKVLYMLGGFLYLFISCKKEEPHLLRKSDSYKVEFRINNTNEQNWQKNALKKDIYLPQIQKIASVNPMSEGENGRYLYFWSFNGENLLPDVFINKGAKIEFEIEGSSPESYPAGFSHDAYPAGKAVSVRGLQEVIIKMPLDSVTVLDEIGFDISSSDTGPKAFHILYSNDNAVSYDTLSADNQFQNLNAQSKNHFSFLLDTLQWNFEHPLHIKIEALPGDREGVGEMKSTGATRLDNLYLKGEGNFPESSTENTLYYWIFDYLTGDLVIADSVENEKDFSPINLDLKQGGYITHFVSNFSSVPLLRPEKIQHIEDHYLGRVFGDAESEIYGSIDTIEVNEDGNIPIILKRYYNQVHFELTDAQGLNEVDEIRITPLHDPFFYAPFKQNMGNPILDQSDFLLYPDFEEGSNSFFFNQFLGNVYENQNMHYQVEVFSSDSEQPMHTFEVEGTGMNNMKLIFRGRLLSYSEGGFTFSVQEEWDGEEEVEF